LNRDNVLFVLMGLMAGFILGFMTFEMMSDRQPQRLVHGDEAQATPGPPGGGGAGGGAAGGGAPAMGMVEELRQRIAANPEDADAVGRLAELHFQISDWKQAAELYARYQELRPGNPEVLTTLGFSHRNLGQFEEAVAAFDQALEVQPDHWGAQYYKAVVLGIDLKDFPAAEAIIADMRRQDPDAQDLARLVQELEKRQAAAG
jgi:tetratricopeptide (TPR) repeat protein